MEKRLVKKQMTQAVHFLVLGFLGRGFDSPCVSLFGGGVRVELEHGSDVGERVLFGASLDSVGVFWGVKDALNFVTLEEGLEITVLDDSRWDAPVLFGRGTGGEVTVDGVEGFEGVFGEDEESADVSTWRESENIQGLDIEDFDAWDVSEGSDNTVVLGVDDCWSEFLDMFSITRFTSASSCSSGSVNSFDIIPSSHSFQQVNSLFGLFVILGGVADNTWYFWNFVDFVTFSHNESWDTGGSNGTGHSVSSLVDVALFVPSPPGLEWSEHPTSSAHITESGLAGSVGSATSDSRNTSNSSTGTPGFSGGLFTSDLLDSGSLSSILSEVGMDKVDEVTSDWGFEHGWGVDLAGSFACFVVDGNLWSRCGERHDYFFTRSVSST